MKASKKTAPAKKPAKRVAPAKPTKGAKAAKKPGPFWMKKARGGDEY